MRTRLSKHGVKRSASYELYLLELMNREREMRQQNRISRNLRGSKLPLEKTLEAFDRDRLPRKVDAHVNVLLEGSFINRAENVLAFGNPGSGKTHPFLCYRSGADLPGAVDPVCPVQLACAGPAHRQV